MWTLSEPCPKFRIRTANGVIDPESLTGHWLILIHCSRPCVRGCSACAHCFDDMTEQLIAQNCRLMVALDAPDRLVRTRVQQLDTGLRPPWQIGIWEYPERYTEEITHIAVLDPQGIVRALLEIPNDIPLTRVLLTDLLNRAQRQPTDLTVVDEPTHDSECVGCVDWFDFDVVHRH